MDTPRPLSPEHHGTRTHSELACCLSYLATVPLQRLDDSFWIKAHTQILAQIVRYVVGEHVTLDSKKPSATMLRRTLCAYFFSAQGRSQPTADGPRVQAGLPIPLFGVQPSNLRYRR